MNRTRTSPRARAEGPARDGSAPDVVPALQGLLADLIALSLVAKQAHWNVVGPLFGPLHELFDRIAEETRGWYDDVAERARALGAPAEGRPPAVAQAPAAAFPGGEIRDAEAVRLMLERIEGIANRARGDLPGIGERDLVTQDLVIGIVHGLEKRAWMLRVQAPRR